MRIAVLIKQVPAVDTVKIDEKTGTMVRDGVEAELNPLDLHAVEAAVRIKEQIPADDIEIFAISMGPAQAKKIVSHAIALGCDGGFLLSDRRFGGADTLATSRALAKALEKLGPFDLIFTGERATDGETGQVGPAVSELLGLPVLSYVSEIEKIGDGKIKVRRAIEGGHETLEAPLPCCVIPVKELNIPRLCTLGGKLRAKGTEIPVIGADDLGIETDLLGLSGSPTQVVRVTYPKMTREGKKINATGNPEAATQEILRLLEEKNCLEAAL